MSIAALYDIHANLPAFEAVLENIRQTEVDQIIVGGDVLPGPMPCATLALLLELDSPVQFVLGNGELAVLAQVGAADPDAVTYWGTTSGEALPEPLRAVLRWTADQIHPECDDMVRSWPKIRRLQVSSLGQVLFCHGTPRSETECFTRLTPADRLGPVFEGVEASVVVCGHTHMQFDRVIAGVRVVNAGSMGMPFGRTGADWLLSWARCSASAHLVLAGGRGGQDSQDTVSASCRVCRAVRAAAAVRAGNARRLHSRLVPVTRRCHEPGLANTAT